MNDRIRNQANARALIFIAIFVNIPQIIAAAIILNQYWNVDHPCDEEHRNTWKLWSVVNAVRLVFHSASTLILHWDEDWINEREEFKQRARRVLYLAEGFGIIWFIIGNFWLFASSGDSGMKHYCRSEVSSPLYSLTLAMIVLTYAQLFLPCVIAVLLVPLICLCMPCIIRFVARMNRDRGAPAKVCYALCPVPYAVSDRGYGCV